MAKFCIYCGKELAEGEVCNCQSTAQANTTASSMPNGQQQGQFNGQYQQQVPFNGQQQAPYQQGQGNYQQTADQFINVSKGYLNTLIGLVKKPAETMRELANTENKTFGFISIGLKVIIGTLILLLTLLYYDLGEFTVDFCVPYFFAILITNFAMVGLIKVVSDYVFKEKHNIFAILSLVGAKAVVTICALFVASIVSLVSSTLGFIIFASGVAYGIILFVYGFISMTHLDANKQVLFLFIISVIYVIILGIMIRFMGEKVAQVIYAYIMDSVSNAFGSMF